MTPRPGGRLALAAGTVLVATSGLLGGGAGYASAGVATIGRAVSRCSGSVGVMAPTTGVVAVIGLQQLHWALYAASIYNREKHTDFQVLQGDTEFRPSQARIVARHFVSNTSILAVVGPSASSEVEAVGPIMGNAGLGFITASATADALFSGKNPTFFSVVAKNGEEGPFDARFIAKHLGAKNVAVIDDGSAYSVELANRAETSFRRLGVSYTRLSVTESETDYAAVIRTIPAKVSVAYLPWQVAGNAELFARQLVQEHRRITLVGSDGLSLPSEFFANGDYVTSFSPDLSQNPADASLVTTYLATYHGALGTYGPPEFVAMMVALNAISAACASGAATRPSVLAALRATDLPTSLLGTPIRFNRYGRSTTARFYIFEVKDKSYVEIS